jgi:BirA family biotin operon repressor/biotin-[acetyl-CoA-carboxylase] ligase
MAVRGRHDARSGPRVVELLRGAAGDVSGSEIASAIGISRAAVWKHIERLREDGYRIEGTPARGYRLLESPDRLSSAEVDAHLLTKRLGRTLHYADDVDSTNRWARELARAGAREGTVVIADAQTAGRGRLGREWFSPAGRNLYISVILRPAVPPGEVPQLALVAASAVAAALRDVAGLRPAIKWPNDVLIDRKKVAGILAEMDSEADLVTFAVVGIGVNLNVSARELGPTLRRTATSVRVATGKTTDRAAFTGRLLGALEERYCRFLDEGFGALRDEWEQYSCLTGRRVTVAGADGVQRGQVVGVDRDGALCLRVADGKTVRVLAGDVTLPGAYGRGRRATADRS